MAVTWICPNFPVFWVQSLFGLSFEYLSSHTMHVVTGSYSSLIISKSRNFLSLSFPVTSCSDYLLPLYSRCCLDLTSCSWSLLPIWCSSKVASQTLCNSLTQLGKWDCSRTRVFLSVWVYWGVGWSYIIVQYQKQPEIESYTHLFLKILQTFLLLTTSSPQITPDTHTAPGSLLMSLLKQPCQTD